ncbi:hypothetical protein BH11PLA2_BH11PLA2_04300 [soil metagenome]
MRPSLRIVFSLLFICSPAFAAEADPAKLKPTTEQIFKAEQLAAKLGSEIFLERDTASRELAAMGRVALGVIDRVLAETDDAEVRSRCEALRPVMAEEDLKARLDAFIADADGKFDHKLPAWDKFKGVVGSTAATRTLFAQMYESAPTAKLLTASVGPKEDFTPLVVARRMEIYNRIYGRTNFNGINRINGNIERVPPSTIDVAGLLFAEGLMGSSTDRRYSYAINTMLQQASVKETLTDEVKGATLRKLFANWCETRTDPNEIYTAMTTATNLDLKDVPASKYAIKVLEAKTMTPFYKAYAMTTLAKSGKDQLPILLKQFDDKTVINTAFVNANGQVEKLEMQLRDVALAMAVLVTDQKTEDYGFNARATTVNTKFTYNNYRLPSEEKRTEAFKKWDEYLKANPLKK